MSIPASTSGGDARANLGDNAFVLVLTALGLFGLHAVYGGYLFLGVGVLGTVIGIAIAELAFRLHQPVLAEVAVALLAFLLLGGATTSGHGIERIIPSLGNVEALSRVGVYGWKDLLTTAPPVGDSSDLLAIPYVLGLIAGVGGSSSARRTRSIWLPLLAPLGVLAISILFGSPEPASLLVQGALFAVLAMVWIAVRFEGSRPAVTHGSHRRRNARAAAVLAVATVAAAGLGPRLPGADSHSRVVLSRYVVPPFQSSEQPSPLAAFRRYVPGGALHSKVLFTAQGLSAGSVVRIATMDEYDGVTWGFGSSSGNATSPEADVFRTYGSTVQTAAPGSGVDLSVRVGALDGVWLPEVGEVDSVSFTGTNAGSLGAAFRYDTNTETAAEAEGLQPGERYSLESSVVRPVTSNKELDAAAPGDAQLAINGVPQVLGVDAVRWSANAEGAYRKVMAIAKYLRTTGYFSDGLESPPLALPGHNAGRLTSFLDGDSLVGPKMVGDGEQYAATFALMANAIGVPARVVLGATVESGGTVRGSDVAPFVEIDLSGLGWQPIPATDFMDPARTVDETPPQPQPSQAAVSPVEPSVQSALHSPLLGQMPGAASSESSHFVQPPVSHFRLPGWIVTTATFALPFLLIVASLGFAIAGLKLRRRQRRRRAATADRQIAGAWSELIDGATDLGVSVPRGRTRSEQAHTLGLGEAGALAVRGDASVFGPGQPSDEEVVGYWSEVERLLGQLRRELGRFVAWRARFSIRSLRSSSASAGAK